MDLHKNNAYLSHPEHERVKSGALVGSMTIANWNCWRSAMGIVLLVLKIQSIDFTQLYFTNITFFLDQKYDR